MDWVIEPLVGVGPLRLGMQAGEVASVLDNLHPITDRPQVFDGSIAESRGLGVPACSYDGDFLRGIDTNFSIENVFFQEKDVYKSKPKAIMQSFAKLNGGAKFGLGVLLFSNIAVSAIGFFDEQRGFKSRNLSKEQTFRGVNVYVRDAFDKYASHFSEVDLGEY